MKTNTKQLVLTALTGAIYAALTLLLPLPAYGQIQFRLSEILNLLAFVNPVFAPGIILGCFIANLFSTVSPIWDAIVGTGASAITMLFITRYSKNLFIASLWPTVFCVFIGGLIIFTGGIPLTILNYVTITAGVMAGEFVVMTLVGYPFFKQLYKNKKFISFLKQL